MEQAGAARASTEHDLPQGGLHRRDHVPQANGSDWPPALPGAINAVQDEVPEWTDEEIVLLHWRLLQELSKLADPATPLEEKLDTLRWVFTERDKDVRPFSFVSCLKVVGCSPLSPIAYCGWVDPEDIRHHILAQARAWLKASLQRYPSWVREAVLTNPSWVERRLASNPQWINEQLKHMADEGDLFA